MAISFSKLMIDSISPQALLELFFLAILWKILPPHTSIAFAFRLCPMLILIWAKMEV